MKQPKVTNYFVTMHDKRIGSVQWFAGNKPGEQWVGFSIHTEEHPGFKTRKAAFEWVTKQAEKEEA